VSLRGGGGTLEALIVRFSGTAGSRALEMLSGLTRLARMLREKGIRQIPENITRREGMLTAGTHTQGGHCGFAVGGLWGWSAVRSGQAGKSVAPFE